MVFALIQHFSSLLTSLYEGITISSCVHPKTASAFMCCSDKESTENKFLFPKIHSCPTTSKPYAALDESNFWQNKKNIELVERIEEGLAKSGQKMPMFE
mmetsp:Transcript_28650/g.70926  ORF Transcript_28650/g.70926 Transcript_28650/m.70926 type:complete len:99 (+) Transcript_28650:353-649(+)